jgi:tetratricopeptide (TPR) repeat protein
LVVNGTSRVNTRLGGGLLGPRGAGPVPTDALQPAAQVWSRTSRRPTFARVYLGSGNTLELVSLQVTVTIEGPRARTVVDHIFHNPHGQQLEGTFEYPLPTGASPSYFAMFLGQTRETVPARFSRKGDAPALPPEALAGLTPAQLASNVSTADWGTLREARVVGKDKALETYEDVVRGRIDPALLEYSAGNTFSARVFPIPARGYNRVLIAYEELLPCTQERAFYRYPLPDCKLSELQFTLQADAGQCKNVTVVPKDAVRSEGAGRLLFTRTWKKQGPGGEVQFACTPAQPQVQATSGRQGESGPLYLYARIRPDLKVAAAKSFAENAVFLLDTSLSEYPGRFDVSVKLLRKILQSDPDIKRFNILTFNIGSAWVSPRGWLDNTPAGRDQALARLDGIVLEGATDLSAALDALVQPGFDIARGTPLNVFLLSDGQITWGEADVNMLVSRFENRCPWPTRFHCYRTGIGAENLELFEGLVRKGGGIFNCFTEADLPAAARAHRTQCFQVERVSVVGGPAASDVLVAGRKGAVYPGGELVLAARLNAPGKTQIVLEGTFQGHKHSEEYPVEVRETGELAARGWGEIAVASLLALNDPKLDGLVTAYCQQFGIGSRVASFLVLENDNDYKRFNLEAERGKTVSGDLGKYLEDMWQGLSKALAPRESFVQFLMKLDPRVHLLSGPNAEHVSKLLALLADADFDVPAGPVAGAILRKQDVPPAYLAARDRDLGNVDAFLTEARRRSAAGDADGALRVLSSVIEEYPARSDALRLVGYRLLDLQQAAQAVSLFQRVQRDRPFEPHSYRDLARSLEECGRFGLAAVQYEVLLAGTWHNRFHESLKLVAQEEYARMMQDAIRRHAVSKALANHFGERLERMANPQPKSDLRVTISWNTDATDVDLWVLEPDGTKCFYQNRQTTNGGVLSEDQTQGYGPERYQVAKTKPGVYTVVVHYYRANANLLGGETHVNVVVTRHAGSPTESSERRTVILKHANEQVEVCKVKF